MSVEAVNRESSDAIDEKAAQEPVEISEETPSFGARVPSQVEEWPEEKA